MMLDQLAFLFDSPPAAEKEVESVLVGDGEAPIHFRSNPRARRYLLSVHRDGSIHVTIPRRGSQRQARIFVQEKIRWIERQRRKIAARGIMPVDWPLGTEVMVQGSLHRISAASDGEPVILQLGPLTFPSPRWQGNLRPLVEEHLHGLARQILIPRTEELAQQHQIAIHRVTVRNQSSRWGSCSALGNISLNWRLVQTPPLVSDYIIVHELMHRREMNHSPRFWSLVDQAYPAWRDAEQWIKENAARLGM
jgi:predicted metal-dependent hydrolase